MKRVSTTLLALLFLPPDISLAEGGSTQRIPREYVILVGSISETIKEEVSDFKPLTDYLAARLKERGILKSQVVVSQSIPEMVDLVKKGEVDLYTDSAFPVLQVSKLAGMRPMLRRWKRGKADYHSVIFVRKDSGIESVSDLMGKTIGFDQPSSTSGYLIPKAVLIRAGMAVGELESRESRIPEDSIGYVFTQDDENTLFWVLEERVAAGAMDNESFDSMSGRRKDELKVLERSISVPRHLVAFRSSMDSTLSVEIRNVLIEMHENEEGRKALVAFQHTTKFDTFRVGADEALKPIQKLMEFVTK